jgi:hypothetical protein
VNLSIFNFKISRSLKLILYFIVSFFLLNLFVYFLPEDYSGDLFRDGISYKNDKLETNYQVKDVKVVAFGDSKATLASKYYFSESTLSLAAPNNTIIFSKFIFDKLKINPLFKPKFVILYIGPNNFNQNGIFTKRDYAVRKLATFSQLFEMAKMNDGFGYAFDGFISKLIPLYGRRIEIRHPINLWKLINKDSKKPFKMPGMQNNGDISKHLIKRDANIDKNYSLIYERSVYNDYTSSKLHIHYLEKLISDIIDLGAKPILIELPIEKQMQSLRNKLVGNKFNKQLTKIREKYNFIYIDAVNSNKYQFLDVNHLSAYGHKKFIKDKVNPIFNKTLIEN